MKLNINIKTIKTIGLVGNLSADVLFELNDNLFWAFCYPCNFIENTNVDVFLDFIEQEIPENLFWEFNTKQSKTIIRDNDDKLRYYCYGEIKSINPVTIDVGNFTLIHGNWINDKNVIGSYVYFVISRLDINDCSFLT